MKCGGSEMSEPNESETSKRSRRRATIAIVIALISAVGALASAWFAYRANTVVQEIARAELFLTLRVGYQRIAADLPANYVDPQWHPPKDEEDWKKIKRYWYHTFTEWYATTQVRPSAFEDLWDNFYSVVIAETLKLRPMRYVYCDLRDREFKAKPYRQYVLAVDNSFTTITKEPAVCPVTP